MEVEYKTKQSALKAVRLEGGHALQYASEELKSDREVVLEAVEQSGYALEFASKKLQKDKEILKLVK